MRWVALVVVALILAGCSLPPPSPTPSTSTPTTSSTPPPTSTPISTSYVPKFDADRAFADVEAQLTTGNDSPLYRIPGTEGNDLVADQIRANMETRGYDTSYQWFNATYGCNLTTMHNVVAERAGTSGKIVMFGAHYDTRPIADNDPDPANRDKPILGASDGASGVAVLEELARVLPPTNDTVRFIFFDGEDGGGYLGPRCTDWILGSRAYANALTGAEVNATRAFVLVDMIGDPHVTLPREGFTASDPASLAVQSQIYAEAGALGHAQFLNETSYSIDDDHLPFLDRHIPSVDLIHLIPDDPHAFPAWHHTLADDISVVSPASLAAVGGTLEAWSAHRAG